MFRFILGPARAGSHTALLVALSLALVAAAAGNAFAAPVPPANNAVVLPCGPSPTLWASDMANDVVNGYVAGSAQPICRITGSPSLHFSSVQSLATGPSGDLYVADRANDRIVVFNMHGVYLRSISTDIGNTQHHPRGVCLSPKGRIGVADGDLGSSTGGFVEFFASDGTLVGTASGAGLGNASFCTFDRSEDFFVDGVTTSGATQIWYVHRPHILTMNTPLITSNAGSGTYWLGMYSSKSGGNTVSVAGAAYGGSGCSTTYCVKIVTYLVNASQPSPGNVVLTLTAQSTCQVTSYPSTGNAVYQIAMGPSGGALYLADATYMHTNIVKAAQCGANGGTTTVSGFAIVPFGKPFGVAAYPSGQY